MAYAKELAKEFGATLTLLHSVALQYFVSNDEYVRCDLPLLTQRSEKLARDQMRDLVAKMRVDSVKIESINTNRLRL